MSRHRGEGVTVERVRAVALEGAGDEHRGRHQGPVSTDRGDGSKGWGCQCGGS